MKQKADSIFAPNWTLGIAAIAATCLLSCCSPDRPPLAPSLASLQTNVFDVHCALSGCHVGERPESGLRLERGHARPNLVGVPSIGIPDRIRVVPGSPDGSYILDKLRGRQIVGERMPLGRAPLPDSLIEAIESWISAGAPD